MRRLSIFVFYDQDGILNRYAEYMIRCLTEVSEKIVVVVNGKITDEGRDKILSITPYIYQRENLGFDAGAYKDTFLIYLKDENLEQYDEIIMQNDTFYGPFFGWQEVFTEMESQSVDFWGLSRHADSEFTLGGERVVEHIQSFFLVCRKNVFLRKEFLDFWNKINYPKDLIEAVCKFEIGFSSVFKSVGCVLTSYLDIKNPALITGDGGPAYMRAFEIISEAEFPVVKRKALSICFYENDKKLFDFLRNHTDYDVSMIYEHLRHLEKSGRIEPYGYNEIKEFVKKHRKIYIYGRGIFGRAVAQYLKDEGLIFEKFVITNNNQRFEDTIEFKELQELPEEDGVIVALRMNSYLEVLPNIKKTYKANQLLCPRYYDVDKRRQI